MKQNYSRRGEDQRSEYTKYIDDVFGGNNRSSSSSVNAPRTTNFRRESSPRIIIPSNNWSFNGTKYVPPF